MNNYTEKGSLSNWDHISPLYSRMLDKYFNTLNDIYEYFDDPWQIDGQVKEDFDIIRHSYAQLCNYLELYLCLPRYFPELEIPEFLYIDIPDNYDDIYDAIPQDHPIIQKIKELNQFIFQQSYILWYEQSRIKPIPASLDPDYKIDVDVKPRRRREPFDD